MGLMGPHVRILRAEANSLKLEADDLGNESTEQRTAAIVLLGLAAAKLTAANAIEESDARLSNKIYQIPARGH